MKVKSSYYYHVACFPNCYTLHRPDGTEIAFLQGDDARDFEKTLAGIYTEEYPFGIFDSYDQLLSMIIDQYDC